MKTPIERAAYALLFAGAASPLLAGVPGLSVVALGASAVLILSAIGLAWAANRD